MFLHKYLICYTVCEIHTDTIRFVVYVATLPTSGLYNVDWWNHWWMLNRKDLEERGSAPTAKLSRHSTGGTDENHENISRDFWFPDQDSYWKQRYCNMNRLDCNKCSLTGKRNQVITEFDAYLLVFEYVLVMYFILKLQARNVVIYWSMYSIWREGEEGYFAVQRRYIGACSLTHFPHIPSGVILRSRTVNCVSLVPFLTLFCRLAELWRTWKLSAWRLLFGSTE